MALRQSWGYGVRVGMGTITAAVGVGVAGEGIAVGVLRVGVGVLRVGVRVGGIAVAVTGTGVFAGVAVVPTGVEVTDDDGVWLGVAAGVVGPGVTVPPGANVDVTVADGWTVAEAI